MVGEREESQAPGGHHAPPRRSGMFRIVRPPATCFPHVRMSDATTSTPPARLASLDALAIHPETHALLVGPEFVGDDAPGGGGRGGRERHGGCRGKPEPGEKRIAYVGHEFEKIVPDTIFRSGGKR